jgi:hypothetical protein
MWIVIFAHKRTANNVSVFFLWCNYISLACSLEILFTFSYYLRISPLHLTFTSHLYILPLHLTSTSYLYISPLHLTFTYHLLHLTFTYHLYALPLRLTFPSTADVAIS